MKKEKTREKTKKTTNKIYSDFEVRVDEMQSILPGFYTMFHGKKIHSKSINFRPWSGRKEQ